MTTTNKTTAAPLDLAQFSHIHPAGFGAWDVTSYPYGGDFIRYKSDIPLRNVRESQRANVFLADCELPGRNGIRTIATSHAKAL